LPSEAVILVNRSGSSSKILIHRLRCGLFWIFIFVAQSARFILCLNQDDGREEGKFYMILVCVFRIIVLKDSPDW
jgi:hypothetical protein